MVTERKRRSTWPRHNTNQNTHTHTHTHIHSQQQNSRSHTKTRTQERKGQVFSDYKGVNPKCPRQEKPTTRKRRKEWKTIQRASTKETKSAIEKEWETEGREAILLVFVPETVKGQIRWQQRKRESNKGNYRNFGGRQGGEPVWWDIVCAVCCVVLWLMHLPPFVFAFVFMFFVTPPLSLSPSCVCELYRRGKGGREKVV